MFSECSALQSVTFPEGFGQAATNMRGMFYGCEVLTDLDRSKFNTENCTNMQQMFYNCSALTLNCSGWNVDNVTAYSDFNTNAPGVIAPAWVN